MKNRMQLQLSTQKRRQFMEEIRLRWNLDLDQADFLHNACTANEIISLLHETVGLSLPRAERELGEMMRNFEEKVRRAA